MKETRLFWIFLGGSFSAAALRTEDQSLIKGMVCADSGANHTFSLGLIPDIIVGDKDSILPQVMDYYQKEGVEFINFPREKNFSDGEAALEAALNLGATDIVIYGAFGKRVDHEFANIFLASRYTESFGSLILKGDDFEAQFISGPRSLEICGEPGSIISIVPLNCGLDGLTLKGFEYPLNNASVYFGSTLTISNKLKESRGLIKLKSGLAMVFTYR